MKNGYFLLLIALGCMVGCHKIDVPASEGLYKRWKAENADQYITFLHEGIILYGADGKDDNCCLYNRFFQPDGKRLIFQGTSPKTIPVTLNPVNCANVSCYSPTSIPDWQIVSLTTDRLVLNSGNGSNQTYVAAP